MDDLKLHAKNCDSLEGLLNIRKRFNNDIRMQFGLEKICENPI